MVAVAGHNDQPSTFYFGGAAGGLWKSTDAGWSWRPLTDEVLRRPSVGSVAVAQTEPNRIYIGTGEACVRGDVARGDGIYRSKDGGRSWQHCGLPESHHVGRIIVSPRDEDLVYCAALGHLYGPNSERGVYRSFDGGESWELVLSRDENTGAVDLAFDPANPLTIFATLWQVRRTPWSLSSGGSGSGLFVTHDGGDSWTEITSNEGLPQEALGKIGVAVAPGDRGRVWAIIEAAESPGLYRSDDRGETWELLTDESALLQRPFYYMHVIAHPCDLDCVYVMNMRPWRSTDGGRTFTSFSTDHGDEHALWISASSPDRMILGNDGGAVVSIDGGETWTLRLNEPISAFYNAVSDEQRPYRVYGPQQDSTTLTLPSRTETGLIALDDCYPIGGCESGWVAPSHERPATVFAAGYDGTITRFDAATRSVSDVTPWPDNRIGSKAGALLHRFNWSTPVVRSQENGRLYCASQVVFASDDDGVTWSEISPDLTVADPATLEDSGGVTLDNYTTEHYATIIVLAIDPLSPSTLWTGSDDGRIHVTRDGGGTWSDVTPPVQPFTRITSIEPSRHEAGVVYATGNRERLDDETPIAYRSNDGGTSWNLCVEGLPSDAACRSIRCDECDPNVLYLGTDIGVFASFDAAATWETIQANLPHVPVYDLCVTGGDLVAATHGRSFWVLDNVSRVLWQRRLPDAASPSISPVGPVTVLRDTTTHTEPTGDNRHVYITVSDFVKARGVRRRSDPEQVDIIDAGVCPPNQIKLYGFASVGSSEGARFRIVSAAGETVRELPIEASEALGSGVLKRSEWDLRYAPADTLEPERVWSFWGNYLDGPLVAPGTYTVEFEVDGAVTSTELVVLLPSGSEGREEEARARTEFLLEVRDRTSAAHKRVHELRAIVEELENADRWEELSPELVGRRDGLVEELQAIEHELVARNVIGPGDYHRYPSAVNGRLMGLATIVADSAGPVTAAHRKVLEMLAERQSSAEQRYRGLAGEIDGLWQALTPKKIPRGDVDLRAGA